MPDFSDSGHRWRNRMKKWIVPCMIFTLFACAAARAEKAPALWLNEPAPGFTLESADGKKISLNQFKGKNPVIVAFWHPQMDVSVQQLKELDKVLKDKAFKDVKTLAVTFGKEVKDRDAARDAFKKAGLDFPLLLEKRTDASSTPVEYMVSYLPAFFIIDKKGNLAAPPVTLITEKINGKSFSALLKDALAGKKVNACDFAPEPRTDEPYKKLFAMIGKPAPDFSATDTSGVKQSLSYYKGKRSVLLIFFYPGCGHCRRELPQLHSYNEKWAAKQGVQLLAINIDGSDAAQTEAVKFFKLFGMKYPLINQGKNAINEKYGVNSVPTLFLIDKKGIVRNVFIGEFAMPGDVLRCLAGKMK
jgi:peroxiredoxin